MADSSSEDDGNFLAPAPGGSVGGPVAHPLRPPVARLVAHPLRPPVRQAAGHGLPSGALAADALHAPGFPPAHADDAALPASPSLSSAAYTPTSPVDGEATPVAEATPAHADDDVEEKGPTPASDDSADLLGLGGPGRDAKSTDSSDFLGGLPAPGRDTEPNNSADFLGPLGGRDAESPDSANFLGDFAGPADGPDDGGNADADNEQAKADEQPARKKSRYEILAKAREAKARLAAHDAKQSSGRLAIQAFEKAKGKSARGVGTRKVELTLKTGRRKTFNLGLVVQNRVVRGSAEAKTTVTDAGDMDIAWSTIRGARNVGRAFGVNHETVHQSREMSSCASMVATIHALEDLLRECKRDPPAFACSALKWDEAEQKLAIDLGPLFAAKHTTSGWKTLLSRHRVRVGWSSGRVVECPILRPPVPLLDTSAECLDSGLFMAHYPKSFLCKVEKLVGQILSTATIAFRLAGTDGAYGNLRLVAHQGDVSSRDVLENPDAFAALFASLLCQNHRNGLIEASATSLTGLAVVNAMRAQTGFLQMSGHFARLVLAGDVVSGEVVMRPGKAPKHLSLYQAEILDYTLSNHKAERAAHSRAFKATDNAHEHDARKMTKFNKSATELSKFIVFEDGQDVHYCGSASCCNNYDLETCKAEARRLRRDVLVPGVPERPEEGKWTKLGSALDFQILSRPNKFMLRAWRGAFGKIEVQYAARAAADAKKAENRPDSQKHQGEATLTWHASASKKCRRTKDSLGDLEHDFNIIALALVLEAQRFLTRHLLKASRDQEDPTVLPTSHAARWWLLFNTSPRSAAGPRAD